jgi:hypothetical protein
LPTVANGQALPPGINGNRLRPGVDSLAIFLIQVTDTVRTGSLRDELSVIGHGADARLLRVYESADRVLGVRLDSVVDRLVDLKPLSYHSRTERRVELVDFEAGSAKGYMIIANGDTVPIDVPVDTNAFNSATFDLLIRSADLAVGVEFIVPAFIVNTRSITPLRGQVSAEEEVEGGTCWVVEAEFAGLPVTFWIDQRTRRLVQQVMELRPGVKIWFASPRVAARFRAA